MYSINDKPDSRITHAVRPEILAPAGTMEALRAACGAGADAVYVGGHLFSARAFAGNFDQKEMTEAIRYCHLYGIKLYMALNTLLKDDEIGLVPGYVRPYYEEGLDGVIVQDAGVISVLREHFPDLPLHGSTQMSISSAYGAAFLKSAGLTRVVPARELSLDEIISLKKNTDIEIETFVHGAMCFSYSGRCLFSSFYGGRSGNRGRCAQPCRQRYSAQGSAGGYIMSLKDMCTVEDVPALCEAGIDSFKIEGRMKKPEYVAMAVRAYTEAADMWAQDRWNETRAAELADDLRDIYNRGGFSKGYYYTRESPDMLCTDRPNHNGLLIGHVERVAAPKVYVRTEKSVSPGDVLEIRGSDSVELTSASGCGMGGILELNGRDLKKIKPGQSVFRTRSNELIERIRKELIEPEKTISAGISLIARVGEPLTIKVYDSTASAQVYGAVVSRAQNRPAEPQRIAEKLLKTGGSGVRISDGMDIDIAPDAFISMSGLNSLRREAVEKFKEEKLWQYRSRMQPGRC